MLRDMPLFAYRAKVEDLADKRTGEPMYGDSIDHAAITLRNIFSRADGAVKILTGDLNEETYGRKTIVNEVENFLKDGSHSLQILYEEENLVSIGAPSVDKSNERQRRRQRGMEARTDGHPRRVQVPLRTDGRRQLSLRAGQTETRCDSRVRRREWRKRFRQVVLGTLEHKQTKQTGHQSGIAFEAKV